MPSVSTTRPKATFRAVFGANQLPNRRFRRTLEMREELDVLERGPTLRR